MKITHAAVAAVLCGLGSVASANGWTLDADSSRIAFGSVKNAYVGEVHSFTDLSGTVERSGDVGIEIDLGSLETNIDIRNERMAEHVFAMAPSASLSATIDMSKVDSMRPGESTVMEVDFVLSLLGEEIDLFAEVFVARLGPRKALVSTNDMIFAATDELGVDSGIDTLQELAGLDSIARSTPITARFVFER